MRMLDLRRARSTSLRMLAEDARRESSFCMPAFIAAAAASECGGVCEAGGDWEIFREGSFAVGMREWRRGEAEGDGDGGSEFKSGGMAAVAGTIDKGNGPMPGRT